jgi:hypothetical protein
MAMKTFDQWYKQARRAFLIEALIEAKGNQCVAAAELGIHRNTLYHMLREDGVTPVMVRSIRRAQPAVAVPDSSNITQNIYRTAERTLANGHQCT